MNRHLVILTSLLLSILVGGCGPLDLLSLRKFQDGVSQTTPLRDGVTQTTPLVTGEIRLASGEPAANVSVSAYVSEYRVSAIAGDATRVEAFTDASGRFVLVNPPVGMNTIEAEASPESKAIRLNVPVSVGARVNLDPMTLQPTGAITGRVKADGTPDLLGVTVFIPGTHYVGITDANGLYTLKHVPAGTYEVAAMRPTFATAVVSGVTVEPRQTVQAPEIVLNLDAPVLESLSQTNGGAGTELVIRGQNFGASKNTVLMIKFGSTQATRFERVSDAEIRVWVPEGAVSGPVVVFSNGVASNAREFQVIARLNATPYYAGLFVGDRRKFEVQAWDAMGKAVPNPFFIWELGAGFLGTLSEQGELSTREAGWSEIRAKSGEVVGSAAVGVTPFEITPTIALYGADAGSPGHVIVRSEGRYYTHRAGDRIFFEPTGGGRVVLAGTGEKGFSPDGTPALEAKLDLPEGLAVDADGNLYFTERGNHLVRVIPRADTFYAGRLLKAGTVHSMAGTGEPGYSGDGGAATRAQLNSPTAVVLGEGGPLLGGSLSITDAQNGRIREVSGDGTISTLLGGGGHPVTAEGIVAQAFGGSVGYHLARDEAGNLAFSAGHRLLFYCREPGRYFGRSMSAGMVYPVAGQAAHGFDGDGFGTSIRLWDLAAVTLDPQGNLYFCESGTGAVRVLTRQGHVRWLAGLMLPPGYSNAPMITEAAPATSVRLSPYCLALGPDGSLIVGDSARLYVHTLRPRAAWPLYSQ